MLRRGFFSWISAALPLCLVGKLQSAALPIGVPEAESHEFTFQQVEDSTPRCLCIVATLEVKTPGGTLCVSFEKMISRARLPSIVQRYIDLAINGKVQSMNYWVDGGAAVVYLRDEVLSQHGLIGRSLVKHMEGCGWKVSNPGKRTYLMQYDNGDFPKATA
jgi:hypothetical protein